MVVIKKMADRLKELNDSVPIEFSQIEIDFGIALDYQVGAVLASTTTKASIDVKLVWDRKAQSKARNKNARRNSSSKPN